VTPPVFNNMNFDERTALMSKDKLWMIEVGLVCILLGLVLGYLLSRGM